MKKKRKKPLKEVKAKLNEQTIKEALLTIIKLNPDLTVSALVNDASNKLKMSAYDVAKAVHQLLKEGKIKLEDPNPPKSLLSYVRSSYSLWFWGVMGSIALTIASIYLFPQAPPCIYLRYILGSIFAVYLPGYTLVEAFFPLKESLSGVERFALSIGLSLALVPLTGLALNYTPWGIRLNSTLTALTILTSFLAIFALIRKFKLTLIINTSHHDG